ncbi:MAG: MarR family transcriptional regulator [Deinococcales bacterium]
MNDVLHVTRSARRLGRALSSIAAEPVQRACGLSLKELMVLRAFEGESAHPHELSDRTGTAAPLVTRALDRLSELGYVERRPDTADRRRVVVVVTGAGADASAAGWDALGEVLKRAFRDVPDGAFARLAEDMEALSRVAEAQLDADRLAERDAVGGGA